MAAPSKTPATSSERRDRRVKGRVKRPESRRQELLDSALQLFREQGVDRPTVSDITEAARAAKGTFYRYFDTKEDLVLALQHKFEDELASAMGAARAASDDAAGYERIRAVIEATTEHYLANAWVHDALFRTGHTRSPDLAEAAEGSRSMEVVINLIREGVEAGEFECQRPDLTGFLVFSAMHGALDRLVHDDAEKEQVVAAMSQLFWRAVQPTS